MSTLTREFQARRGKLPVGSTVNVVDGAREAVFPIGLTSGQGRLSWMPWDGDYPHSFVTGTTGAGKSRLMERWALEPLIGGWGWDVKILDGKGGSDYWAALSNGATLVGSDDDILDALIEAVKELRRRQDVLMKTPITRPRADGVMIEDRASSLRDYLAYCDDPDPTMVPTLMMFDELREIARLSRTRGKKTIKGIDLLTAFSALARSAGVHGVLGMQRIDAEMVGGFLRHNVRSRILFGPANEDAERMVLEGAIIDHPERGLPRRVGDGFAVDIGGHPIVRFHADLLDRDRYLPLAAPPEPDPDSAAPGPGGPSPSQAPEAPAPSRTDAPAPPPGGSAGPPPGRFRPVGSTAPLGVPPSPPTWRRVVFAVRPVVTGPFVRTYLRARALRHLFGPVASGPFYRDPVLALAAKQDAGYRCQGCGASAPVEADHDVPLAFGGADEMGNLRALCIRPHRGGCHGAKTDSEMWVWRIRQRERRRGLATERASGLLGALRRVPVVAWVALTAFLAGRFLGDSWWWCAAIVVGVLTVGVALAREIARKYALGRVFVKPRQPGLDGRATWDDRQEQQARGLRGRMARGGQLWRDLLFNARWSPVILGCLFLAGWTLPRWPGWALGLAGAVL